MLTKKEMVIRIAQLYGKGSNMAMWFADVANKQDYQHTKSLFYEIIKHYNNKEKENG